RIRGCVATDAHVAVARAGGFDSGSLARSSAGWLVLGFVLRIVLDEHTDQLKRQRHHQQQQDDHQSHDDPHQGLHVKLLRSVTRPYLVDTLSAAGASNNFNVPSAVPVASITRRRACPPQSVIYPTADVGVIPRMGCIAVFHQVSNGGPYRGETDTGA